MMTFSLQHAEARAERDLAQQKRAEAKRARDEVSTGTLNFRSPQGKRNQWESDP